jgi:hypothetical protein
MLLSVVSTSIGGTTLANAQEENEGGSSQVVIPVSVTYTYNYYNEGCPTPYPCESHTISESFSGGANLTPVEDGFEGFGSGSYSYTNDIITSPYQFCPNGDTRHLAYNGEAEITVYYQFSIDNDITGGPDTSMYNSSYGVVEVNIYGENMHSEQSSNICGESQSWSAEDFSHGLSCHFFSMNFEQGGTFVQEIPMTDDPVSTATCVLSIGQNPKLFRVFGKVNSLVEGVPGVSLVPISNSRVAIAKVDEIMIKKLSVSKPDFFKKAATSDDEIAEYELNFTDPGDPPRVVVVSLLWYEGKPEFAVTNGQNVSGNHIPVYQALCIDDDSATECQKWKRTDDGYEAEVDFLYGSQQKLRDIATFMELEDWKGSGGNARIQMNSGYIYYQSYRAMKYLEDLSLGTQLRPVMVKSHHISGSCPLGADNAFFSPRTPKPTFGDLGGLLGKTTAAGGGIFICDDTSRTSYPDVPINREWHETGHYLLYEMHAPDFPDMATRGSNHAGYGNPSTNDSYIEGFAEFFAMITNEYYGDPKPYLYKITHSVEDVELNRKAWNGGDEELAIAGVLWDFHDAGREISLGFMLNGTLTKSSKVYPTPADNVALDAKTILQVLDRSAPKTAVEIYNAFVGVRISQVDLDMIFMDHGFFADVADRNRVHDSTAETIRETGSKTNPVRLVRHTPLPTIPGSYITVDSSATLNVTVKYSEGLGYDGYSYIVNANAVEPFYFKMPPEYYPSTALITPVSSEGKSLSESIEVASDEYWDYINSSPPQDGVFKQLSIKEVDVETTSTVQYIQKIRDHLSKVSATYGAGNTSGAREEAVTAFNDYSNHVKAELEQRNATQLSEQTGQMLGFELVQLIRDDASLETIDAKIEEINSRLDEAIVIVPEFPLAAVFVLALVIGAFAFLARAKGSAGYWRQS